MKGYFVVYENEDEQFDIKCDLRPELKMKFQNYKVYYTRR